MRTTKTQRRGFRLRAMTMVEMMTSVAVFTLVTAGLVSVNLFGMRQDELVNSKLGANDQSRLNFNLMLDEIRSGKNVQIGNGSYLNFVPITNGLQQGDTIQIFPSTNLSVYIYYYFVTSGVPNPSILVRAAYTNGVVTTNIVARNITNMPSRFLTNSMGVTLTTNAMCFQAMNLTGTNWSLLTNDPTTYSMHNYVVNVLLQFYQYQYPLTYVGSNYLYDYYQIELSAARRAP